MFHVLRISAVYIFVYLFIFIFLPTIFPLS